MPLSSLFHTKWRCRSCHKFWHKVCASWTSVQTIDLRMLRHTKRGITLNIQVRNSCRRRYMGCRNGIVPKFGMPNLWRIRGVIRRVQHLRRCRWSRKVSWNWTPSLLTRNLEFRVPVRNLAKIHTIRIESLTLSPTISVRIGIRRRLNRS